MKTYEKGMMLVIDDNNQNLQYLGNLLMENDFEVGFSQDATQALEFVKETIPDLILLDIRMPEMDGIELCKEFKKNEKMKNIPIIFITALNETEDIVRALEAGGVDYVTKPFQPLELLARVSTHYELKMKTDQLEELLGHRKELLHTVCHDILSPTIATKGLLDILAKDNSRLDNYLPKLINLQTHCLNFLKLAKQMLSLEEGKVKLILENHNLSTQIMSAVELLQDKFDDKEIKIDLQVDENIHVQVDQTSFVLSVLCNIFSNSIKFSAKGTTISVIAKTKGDKITLILKDQGIGIPENILINIFDSHRPTTRVGLDGEKGTGFGMPIMRNFINLYGGDVSIRSVEENQSPDKHGTEFEISLLAA